MNLMAKEAQRGREGGDHKITALIQFSTHIYVYFKQHQKLCISKHANTSSYVGRRVKTCNADYKVGNNSTKVNVMLCLTTFL